MKKKLIIGGLLVLSVAVIFAYDLARVNRSTSVAVVQVAEGTIHQEIYANGTVESSQVSELTAEVSGKIAAVDVKVGASVAKGDVLMVMDASDVERQLATEQNNLKLIQVEREQVRKQDFEKKKAAVMAGNTDQDDQSDLSSYDLRIDNERIVIEGLQKQLSHKQLTADQDGVVTAVNVDAGQMVQTGASAFEITDTGQLRVKAYLSQIDAGRIRVDMPASVTGDAFPDSFQGTVSYVAPVAVITDPTSKDPTVEVWVAILHAKPELRPGYSASVAIEPPADPHLLAPLAAVQQTENQAYVYKIEDGRAVKVEVALGGEDDTRVEISGDIRSGDAIIADASGISEGEKVKVR